jgi:predicted small secreted protein
MHTAGLNRTETRAFDIVQTLEAALFRMGPTFGSNQWFLSRFARRSGKNSIAISITTEDASMSNRTLAKVINSLLLAAVAVVFAGCNTMHGAGEDIERGGEKIQQKADEHK